MFLGEYQTKFTGKGRIILPSKFRKELTSRSLILSRGFDECIWGFTREGWEAESIKQLSVSANEKEGRNLRRYLFSGAEEVTIDSQGRFVIPKHLLVYAGLKKEVVLLGLGDRFEIWDKKSWLQTAKSIIKDE